VSNTCLNGKLDPGEADLDCGSEPCIPCGVGRSCEISTDCESGICQEGRCLARTCENGKRDLEETGVDCGGLHCSACQDGAGCILNRDCASGFCEPDLLKCFPKECGNFKLDGDESDVDCGARTAPLARIIAVAEMRKIASQERAIRRRISVCQAPVLTER